MRRRSGRQRSAPVLACFLAYFFALFVSGCSGAGRPPLGAFTGSGAGTAPLAAWGELLASTPAPRAGAPLPNRGSLIASDGATDHAPAVPVMRPLVAVTTLVPPTVGFRFTDGSGARDQPPTDPIPAAPADALPPPEDIDIEAA